jgi:septal ring factor EnvC (AmiA/AmiB activator)
MATDKITRYNIKSVQSMIAQLEAWIEQTEETLGNAEDAEYPNEERIDKLNERLASLEQAKDALEEIE